MIIKLRKHNLVTIPEALIKEMRKYDDSNIILACNHAFDEFIRLVPHSVNKEDEYMWVREELTEYVEGATLGIMNETDIVLPSVFCERLSLKEGDKMDVYFADGSIYIEKRHRDLSVNKARKGTAR